MDTFEWITAFIGVLGILGTFVIAVLSWVVKRMFTQTESSANSLENRLQHMENVAGTRHLETTAKFAHMEEKFNNLQVCVEKRMTRLETIVD